MKATKTKIAFRAPLVIPLANYLLDCASRNEIATYQGMFEKLGYKVNISRSALYKAIDYLRENTGLVFRCVPTIGYEVTPNGEIAPDSSNSATTRISGVIAKWKSKLACVDISKLETEETLEYSLALLKASLLEQAIVASASQTLHERARQHADSLSDLNRQKLLAATFHG